MPIPDRATFESAYAGQAPWDIGAPQPAFVAVAGQIAGSASSRQAACGSTPAGSSTRCRPRADPGPRSVRGGSWINGCSLGTVSLPV